MWLWDGASFKRTSFGPIDIQLQAAVNFSIHTGGGGGGRKVSSFMRGEAHKVCLQSGGGGGSKKFSILIFPIYQPPSP